MAYAIFFTVSLRREVELECTAAVELPTFFLKALPPFWQLPCTCAYLHLNFQFCQHCCNSFCACAVPTKLVQQSQSLLGILLQVNAPHCTFFMKC